MELHPHDGLVVHRQRLMFFWVEVWVTCTECDHEFYVTWAWSPPRRRRHYAKT